MEREPSPGVLQNQYMPILPRAHQGTLPAEQQRAAAVPPELPLVWTSRTPLPTCFLSSLNTLPLTSHSQATCTGQERSWGIFTLLGCRTLRRSGQPHPISSDP